VENAQANRPCEAVTVRRQRRTGCMSGLVLCKCFNDQDNVDQGILAESINVTKFIAGNKVDDHWRTSA
jgi:hypothetical protein